MEEVIRSEKFEYVHSQYNIGRMYLATVRKYVEFNDLQEGRGITRGEFEEITGEEY
ncbi:MAG: hypothetical protein R3Y54_13565 [Eubacteriales bacterium]